MKKKTSLILILFTISLFCLPFFSFINNSKFHVYNQKNKNPFSEINQERKSLSLSQFWDENDIDFIYIDGNWSETSTEEWCTGNGTLNDPYIIENITINANLGIGITIKNANEHFTLKNCTVYNGTRGITLYNAHNGTLLDNKFIYNYEVGIRIDLSSNNTLYGNIVSFNGNNEFNSDGILLVESNYNNLTNNFVNDNTANYITEGISLTTSSNNTIIGNEIKRNLPNQEIDGLFYGRGIAVYDGSNNNTIGYNEIEDNTFGMIFDGVSNNKLSGNIMKNCGILLASEGEFETTQIETSNTINNKPIRLFSNEKNIILDNIDIGQILMYNCSEFTISNIHFRYGTGAIYLDSCKDISINNCIIDDQSLFGIYTLDSNDISLTNSEIEDVNMGFMGYDSVNQSIISNNVILNTYTGIYLNGDNNEIYNNEISYNYNYGIVIDDSLNLEIKYNNITNNGNNGIYLVSYSYESEISNNIISNNNIGLAIDNRSENGLIYNNYFENNYLNAQDNGTNNNWDNGSIGNYWSDYTGVDLNNDGIGDIPYNISGTAGSVDHFPIVFIDKKGGSPDNFFTSPGGIALIIGLSAGLVGSTIFLISRKYKVPKKY